MGELEAGPMVQTIFVAILAGTGRSYLRISSASADKALIRLSTMLELAMACTSDFVSFFSMAKY